MRKTKIVCTIGPASNNEHVLEEMCKRGMNVARLNFSHGTHADHLNNINLIKSVRERLGLPIAILLDTKGPEYRTGVLEGGSVNIEEGQRFTFTTRDIIGNNETVSVSYKNLPSELCVKDIILVNNGLLVFEVAEISGEDIICTAITGGELSDRKSMSFPGRVMHQEYLSEQDKDDLLFGIEQGIDFIACSFVSKKQDVLDVKNFVREHTGEQIGIIAKIENRSGIENIEEICEACDGIMVARGDLGVEVPFEELPHIQKTLITRCRMLGKRVITATEMLESMIHNPRPTRAEISDVANAVYDGTSAVMLSGETAAGKYPAKTVETMARIIEKTEESISYEKRFRDFDFKIKNSMDAISHSVCGMSIDLHAKAIVVCSLSGMTARMVSRFRSPVDIIGLSVNERTWRQLALSWGVMPVMCEVYPSQEVLFYTAEKLAKRVLGLSEGDKIIITGGSTDGKSGTTNTIRFATI
ncbi:MAG: pyruvate kinase [Clostridia bacterium]|nr:pyruvate kinase [Clostridia bacterium]